MTKEIELTRGKVAIVDDVDFDWLNQWKWYCSERGYAARRTYDKGHREMVRMHRVIINAVEGEFVDHINCDQLDNRRSNLRIVNVRQNQWNRGANKGGSSGYKGVSYHKVSGKWCAQIVGQHEGKNKKHWLGSYQTEEEAAKAYDAAATLMHGEYVKLNFPNPTGVQQRLNNPDKQIGFVG